MQEHLTARQHTVRLMEVVEDYVSTAVTENPDGSDALKDAAAERVYFAIKTLLDTKCAEVAALRRAAAVEPMPEQMAKPIFDGIASDSKAGQFDAFNWFTAGVASAEQWQKAYLEAALQAQASGSEA